MQSAEKFFWGIAAAAGLYLLANGGIVPTVSRSANAQTAQQTGGQTAPGAPTGQQTAPAGQTCGGGGGGCGCGGGGLPKDDYST